MGPTTTSANGERCPAETAMISTMDGSTTPAEVHRLQSPLGTVVLVAEEAGLTKLQFESSDERPLINRLGGSAAARAHIDRAVDALGAYLGGERRAFDDADLDLVPRGTAFQLRVWEALSRIPYGETRTYGEIAVAVDEPGASRAVGMANNRNPFAIVIPCHRVIGSDGSLTGYGGGLDRKRWLLTHEGVLSGSLFEPHVGRRA